MACHTAYLVACPVCWSVTSDSPVELGQMISRSLEGPPEAQHSSRLTGSGAATIATAHPVVGGFADSTVPHPTTGDPPPTTSLCSTAVVQTLNEVRRMPSSFHRFAWSAPLTGY